MRTIIVFALVFVALENGIYGHSSSEEKKPICTPGSRIKVDCNTCICARDGSGLACTRMACPKIPAELFNPHGSVKRSDWNNLLFRKKRDQVCKPGTMRVWECNNCRCSADGTAEICTRRVCPIVARHTRDIPFSCIPNQSFMQDCNHCFCSPDGQSAGCTLMACLPPQSSQKIPRVIH